MPGVPAGNHYQEGHMQHMHSSSHSQQLHGHASPHQPASEAMGMGGPAGQLPYMEEAELEEFVAQNPELCLSAEEVLYLRLRRRRLSVQRQRGAVTRCDTLKIVAVGDESVQAKQCSLQLFLLQQVTEDAPALAKTTPCAIGRRTVTFTAPQAPPTQRVVEIWAPPCTEDHRTLRKMYYGGTAAFLVYFSVADRVSFDNVRNKWLGEVQHHLRNDTDIPVLVVGTDAEVRHNPGGGGDLVSSEEAVALAQEFGASKYIEVFSHNVLHAGEVIQQTLRALSNTRYWTSPVATVQDMEMYQSLLKPAVPVGHFDLMHRTFNITTTPGTQYYVTYDAADPTLADAEYTGPIRFKKPYPQQICVRAYARCMHPSETLILPIPEETEPPKGYFDPSRRGFFLHSEGAGVRVHYSVEGKPTENSPLVGEAGLLFDGEPPLHAMGSGGAGVPEQIALVAVEDGKFRSRTVTYQAPPTLPQPKVAFSETDRVLRVVSPQPNVEYRYTLNGATPSYDNSSVITNAVMLPRDVGLHRIRVAAFPKLVFPSRVVDVVVNAAMGAAPTSNTTPHVAMTKSARGRIQSSHDRQSRTRTATNSPTRSKRRTASVPKKVSNTDTQVTCATRTSSLDFSFDDPIAITHITVATPGGGRGPCGWRILLYTDARADPIESGSGPLQDVNGVQIMNVDASCRRLHAVKVEVHFSKPQAALFRVNNVQIHGKPVAVACP